VRLSKSLWPHFSLVLWEGSYTPAASPNPLSPPVNTPAWLWYAAMPPVGVSFPFPSSIVGEEQGVETMKVRYKA